jgi:hypothetical protein
MSARYTPFRAPRGACAARATRGEGHTAPPIQKDLAVASYGCSADAGRDNAAEGVEERHSTLSTFETSKYNTCNVCVKHMQHPDKHTCNMRLENTDETYL